MAVNCNKIITIHHRNPSGFNNKIKRLLSISHRNGWYLQQWVNKVYIKPTGMSDQDQLSRASWTAAILTAKNMIHFNKFDLNEYFKWSGVDKLRQKYGYRVSGDKKVYQYIAAGGFPFEKPGSRVNARGETVYVHECIPGKPLEI